MIRLTRPNAPASLLRAAAAPEGTPALWDAWRAGREPQVKASIYGSAPVKAALRKAQHGKCAYCETLLPRDPGQVEHYRPKAGWKQSRSHPLTKPGYFWLAYDMSNFLFCCAKCNGADRKSNLFPLADPNCRASPNAPDVSVELPLLLNPFDSATDPEDHIGWNQDTPLPLNNSLAGITSIETFGLDKDEALIDFRRSHFADIEAMVEAAEARVLPARVQSKIVNVLRKAIKDNAHYAAMIRANFKARIDAL